MIWFLILQKQRPLQWLCKEISHHVLCWTIFDLDLTGCNAISDKKVSNVDVTSTTPAGCFAIFSKQNCIFVVLMDD